MTATSVPRILPLVTPDNAHFWLGGAKGLLQVLQCAECGFYIHPPSPVCPRCHSDRVEVRPLSGRGTVASFTVNYQQWRPDLAVPYVIAIVELPEQAGLRLTTNIVDCAETHIHIGMPVGVRFEQHDDVWLPLFAPVA